MSLILYKIIEFFFYQHTEVSYVLFCFLAINKSFLHIRHLLSEEGKVTKILSTLEVKSSDPTITQVSVKVFERMLLYCCD